MNMGEPVPLSKEDRTFSFGEDVDLSLSLPSTSVKKSEGKEYKKFSAQPPSADLGGLTSIDEHPKESSKEGDPQVGHYEDISTEVPADNANPSYSRLTFSTLSSRPYAESSNEARDRVTGYDSQQYPSDYEVFLAKSREDYENAQRRNWPTVEIDDASFFRAKRGKEYDKRKKLATFRAALRAVQVFVSVIVLALVTLTVSKVRNTSNIAQGSNENLWPQPLVLYPEYIITAISGISFAVSLVAELCLLFVDRLSETKTKLGLGVNFGLNLIFLVIWVLAIILFKVNSSTQFVWGYACNLAGFQNRLLDYQEICSRETGTWAMTIIAAGVEAAIFVLYILTFVRYQAVLAEREDQRRKEEMRKSVHRTMTGYGQAATYRARRRGWEVGGQDTSAPKINVIPAED